MDAPGGAREPRFGSSYGMGLLGDVPDMYGTGRPPSSLGGGLRPGMQPCPVPRGVKRPSDQCYDERPSQSMGLEHCPMPDIADDGYASLQPKKSPPSNGKKTKGRVKIKMEYIDNKLRRYTTFSKRKTGIMKKAYELSTLTGTQVMLLVASETGHVYTFATRKLQPMITSDSGKRLIQTCLNSPDPPTTSEQRMAATGFEETELTYNVVDEDMKNGEEETENQMTKNKVKDEPPSSGDSGDESGSEPESPSEKLNQMQNYNKDNWITLDNVERELNNREATNENMATTSASNQDGDGKSNSQPGLRKILPKLEMPGGAMLYHTPVLTGVGLDGLGTHLGLGNLAMGYPQGFILGVANQGQEGYGDGKSNSQGLRKILPKLEMPGGAMLYHTPVLTGVGLDGLGTHLGLGNLAMGYPQGFILGVANQGQEGSSSSSSQPQFITIPLSMAMAAAGNPTNGCPSASSDDSSELQDLSTGGRK